MTWNLNKDKPICPQLTEHLAVQIARGEFAPEQKLMSVREVAVAAGVNPNTVQKAFEQLEAKGIIYSVRGSGWFVCADVQPAIDETQRVVNEKVDSFLAEMDGLGYSAAEVKSLIEGRQ